MAVNRERLCRMTSVADYDVTGDTLGNLFEKIKSLIADHGADAEVDIYLDENTGYLGVYALRDETDVQMATRIRQEELWDATWEARNNIRNGVK